MTTMQGIIFGIISMFGFGLSNGISKKPIIKIGILQTLVIRMRFTTFLLFCLLLFSKKTYNLKYMLIALGISAFGYIPLLFFYKALEISKVGVVVPIANSYAMFTILGSAILLGETLNSKFILPFGMIIVGIIILSINIKQFKFSKGLIYAFFASIFWGIFFVFVSFPVNVLGPVFTSFLMEFMGMIISTTHLIIKKQKIEKVSKKTIMEIFLISLFVVTAAVSYNFGIQYALVSVVVTLSSAAPLVSTLYGRIFLKEKLKFYQYIAILVILTGIIIISI